MAHSPAVSALFTQTMVVYFGKRFGYSLVTLAFVSIAIFSLIHLIPGDPAQVLLGLRATPDSVRRLRHELGLDRSLLTQYGIFLRNLAHGDLGTSIRYQQSVSSLVVERIGATLFLIAYSAIIAIVVAVPLGTLSALRREKASDQAIRVVCWSVLRRRHSGSARC